MINRVERPRNVRKPFHKYGKTYEAQVRTRKPYTIVRKLFQFISIHTHADQRGRDEKHNFNLKSSNTQDKCIHRVFRRFSNFCWQSLWSAKNNLRNPENQEWCQPLNLTDGLFELEKQVMIIINS